MSRLAKKIFGSPPRRWGKYSGSDAAIYPHQKIDADPVYGLADRPAQGDRCGRNAEEIWQHIDAFL